MKRFSIAKLCVSLTIAGFSVPAVLATGHASHGTPQVVAESHAFDNLDTNRDGYISRSEVPARLKDLRMHFSQYSYDQRLSKAGFASYVRLGPGARCDGYLIPNCLEDSMRPSR